MRLKAKLAGFSFAGGDEEKVDPEPELNPEQEKIIEENLLEMVERRAREGV